MKHAQVRCHGRNFGIGHRDNGAGPRNVEIVGDGDRGAGSDTFELSAAMATPREINFMFPPPAAAGMFFARPRLSPIRRRLGLTRRRYGTVIVESTTVQNAHFGLPEVSNNSGRLVRVTG